MTYIWIIQTGCDRIEKSVILQSKSKSKVGKYIREHIIDFIFMFRKVSECDYHGKIGDDLNDNNLDLDDEDDVETIIKIGEILENYTNDKIVDELYGTSSDIDKNYALINKISTNIIKL